MQDRTGALWARERGKTEKRHFENVGPAGIGGSAMNWVLGGGRKEMGGGKVGGKEILRQHKLISKLKETILHTNKAPRKEKPPAAPGGTGQGSGNKDQNCQGGRGINRNPR